MKAYYIQALMQAIKGRDNEGDTYARVPILKSAVSRKTPRPRPITRNKRKHIKP